MDAYGREMHLGLGCAIENMAVAAGPNGYGVEVAAAPGSLTTLDERQAPVHAATLSLTRRERTAPDALYRAIPFRHTNRYAYDLDRAPPQDWRDFATQADFGDDIRVFLIEDGEKRRLFDAAVVEATEAIIADKIMIADSDRWFRASSAEIDAHRDGPTLDAAGLSFLTLTFARLFPVSAETSHQAWLDQTRDVQLAERAARRAHRRARPLRPLKRDRGGPRLAAAALERDGARAWRCSRSTSPSRWSTASGGPGAARIGRARMAQLTGEDWQATFSFRAGFASQAAPASPRRRLKDVLTG